MKLFETYTNELWKKYADFDGTISRSKFWTAILCNTIILLIFALFLIPPIETLGYAFLSVYFVASAIPFLGIQARRLHDANKSAWNLFYSLIPFVGIIILTIIYCLPTKQK